MFGQAHSHTMAKPLQHQVIRRALELIADEANWSKGRSAVPPGTIFDLTCPSVFPSDASADAGGRLKNVGMKFEVFTCGAIFKRDWFHILIA